MSFLWSNQSQPWITANLLELVNPDTNDWSCVGHAHSQGRRCRNRIARADVVQAKRLLTVLPSIANDTRVLERELARLASLTLCKRWHVKDPDQYIQVIHDWIASIRCTQGLESIALAQQRDQHIHQIGQREQVGRSRRIVDPARQPTASVPQLNYFVEDAASLALPQTVYQPDLQFEQHRHTIQPHRIQQPIRQLFAHALEATYYPQRSVTRPLIPTDRQINQRVRYIQSRPVMDPVREPVAATQQVVHTAQNQDSTSRIRTPNSPSLHREQQSDAAQPQHVVTPVREQNASTPEANHQTNQPHHAPEPDRQRTASAPERCTICLDDVGSNGDRETLRCDHSFCAGCIQRWLTESPSCPLCRDNGLRFIPDPFQARQLMGALRGVQEALQASNDSVVEPSAATPGRVADPVPALPQEFERYGDARPSQEFEQPTATSATSEPSGPPVAAPAEAAAEPSVEQQRPPIETLEAAIEALSVNEQQPPPAQRLGAGAREPNVTPRPSPAEHQHDHDTPAPEQPATPVSDTATAVPGPPTASESPTPASSAQAASPGPSSTSDPATPAPSGPVATQSPPGTSERADCGICLETLGASGATETLPCSHTFCSECISPWLQRSNRCPYRCAVRPRARTNHNARL